MRFLAVGGTTFVLYFLLQKVLASMRAETYESLTAAYVVAVTYHFLMNRYFTFRSSRFDGGMLVVLPRYVGIATLNYFVTLAIVALAVAANIPVPVGMLTAVAITTVLSYFVSHFWVFGST